MKDTEEISARYLSKKTADVVNSFCSTHVEEACKKIKRPFDW